MADWCHSPGSVNVADLGLSQRRPHQLEHQVIDNQRMVVSSHTVSERRPIHCYTILTVSSPLPAGIKLQETRSTCLAPTSVAHFARYAPGADIGAYQTEVFTVNTTTDTGPTGVRTGSGQQGDLRYCVAQANA